MEFCFKGVRAMMNERFDGIHLPLGRVEKHVLRIETRVEAVEEYVKSVRADVAILTKRRR